MNNGPELRDLPPMNRKIRSLGLTPIVSAQNCVFDFV
jgi:hypothetical protein